MSTQNLINRLKTDHINHPCLHINCFNNWCIWCGKTLDKPVYLPHNIHNPEVNSLLNQKKLYLVLDLDHTLLHSIRLANLGLNEEYLKDQTISSLFRLNNIGIITKLRPFVNRFLQEANTMFELCIYTMGNRTYALEMAKLLDPENEYFKSRIISKDDYPERNKKGLDVLKIPESLAVVLDDTEAVWEEHKENLILMDKYCYFSSSSSNFGYNNCKSLSQLNKDEDECDGALANILRVLTQIHHEFYDNNCANVVVRDVRQVLKTTKQEVLRGCKIVFGGVFPRNYDAANHRLWKMAEELGAICSNEINSCVTHVVSVDVGTEKSCWAVREGKFLVHPRWIVAAYYLWRRHSEDKFPVEVA
ncbi:RNA polymerase II C-terminal domain phosphatase-like 4 [Beta vulgaris subsp. vulgaris]|uniref:RNA polymerase II C-terminal domain phosphatase-like 4 n=1 Tax=Beta vulgaris subsp. vulgaris TaxID=3555 RepID=UPI002036EA7E|nr:RNA polymerase II C-terminal domain phosphatase-like 4 [Beta vulgaris subsp. vulgaris]